MRKVYRIHPKSILCEYPIFTGSLDSGENRGIVGKSQAGIIPIARNFPSSLGFCDESQHNGGM